MIKNERTIRSFTGVVRPSSTVELTAARAEDHDSCPPLPEPRFSQQPLDIMRPDGSFEPVQYEKQRSLLRAIEVMQVDEVSVGRFKSFNSSIM